MAGYSNRALAAKIGVKPGDTVLLLDAPDGYEATLGPLPEGASIVRDAGPAHRIVHLFCGDRVSLESRMPPAKRAMSIDGMLWISWPKRASKVPTDLTGNIVREAGLAIGLVDVKVAAIDEVWSGLKFVYRVADRG